MQRSVRHLASLGASLGAAIALALSGCTSSADQPHTASPPQQQPSVDASPSGTPSADASATSSPTPGTTGTAPARPTTALLHWTPLPGSAADTVLSNGAWTLSVGQDGDWWSLGHGAAPGKRTKVPDGLQVATAQMSDDVAVVVYADPDGAKPQRALVTSLRSQHLTTLDRSSRLPPSTDGSWALDGTTLWYATDHAGAYCLASADLGTGKSTLGWCAPARHGFTNIVAAGGQTSMMTFDDSQPSCRTVVSVSGTRTSPYPDVPACKGAQGAVLGAGQDASRIWSMVPDEHRYQQVHVYASTHNGVADLGLGVNSTLTVCGSAAYWARDATGSSPAALMRWDGSRLSIAYQAKGFLGQPLCAGHVLSIVDSSDSGDRQLSARVS
jgi:hypothetical protein